MAETFSEKNLYQLYNDMKLIELERSLLAAKTREERIFWRTLLNLRLQLEQEIVVGETLL